MPEPVINLPTDMMGWIAVLLAVISGLGNLFTSLTIRWRPALQTDGAGKWRRRISYLWPIALMLALGWPALVGLGYADWTPDSFFAVLTLGITAAGGAKGVFGETEEFWREISTPPVPIPPRGG